jgi:hypothetical protein
MPLSTTTELTGKSISWPLNKNIHGSLASSMMALASPQNTITRFLASFKPSMATKTIKAVVLDWRSSKSSSKVAVVPCGWIQIWARGVLSPLLGSTHLKLAATPKILKLPHCNYEMDRSCISNCLDNLNDDWICYRSEF